MVRVKRTLQIAVPVTTPTVSATSSDVDSSTIPSTDSTTLIDTPSSSDDETTLEIRRTFQELAFSSVNSDDSDSVSDLDLGSGDALDNQVEAQSTKEHETEEQDEVGEEDEEEEEEDGDDHLQVVHPNMFAIGDAADSFGAINAGHNAYFQVSLTFRFVFLFFCPPLPRYQIIYFYSPTSLSTPAFEFDSFHLKYPFTSFPPPRLCNSHAHVVV